MHEAKELSNTASTVTIYTNGEEPEFTSEENISVNTMKIQSVAVSYTHLEYTERA